MGEEKRPHKLATWKEEAEQNLKMMGKHFSTETLVDDMKDYKAYNKEEAFEKITGEQLYRTSKIFNFRTIAAAAILLGLVSFFMLKNQLFSPAANTIQYVAKDKEKSLLLTDKTEVLLDAHASLTNTNKREVTLVGRAFFKVAKTGSRDKFVVNTNRGKVTVLGTRFSVQTMDDFIEVAVEEGKVLFENGQQSKLLMAGDWIKVTDHEVSSGTSPSGNQFSWMKHSLEFKDTPLDQAIIDINRHFNVNIELGENVKLQSACLITTKFSNESVEQLLGELKSLFQIQYRKSGNKFVITSIKC